MSNTNASKRYKIVLLGESGVGKSSLAERLVKQKWSETLNSTVGASFFRYPCRVGDVDVCLEIWDTAGQERYRSLASMYYRGAAAALVVYDIISHDTFECALNWVRELSTNSPETIITLVGNKNDLEESRCVSTEECQRYATEVGVFSIETSAKSGNGVQEMFDNIAKTLVEAKNPNSVRESRVIVPEQRPAQQFNCCN
ncbi:unnamed protein product [Phytomonas sp. Hart1]|nr:unnamed protein product [Phytomonas sp. Hart1]|eukprot:CCW66854.1 unnamed protein product [Phytomonas sp. isolate Hart1]